MGGFVAYPGRLVSSGPNLRGVWYFLLIHFVAFPCLFDFYVDRSLVKWYWCLIGRTWNNSKFVSSVLVWLVELLGWVGYWGLIFHNKKSFVLCVVDGAVCMLLFSLSFLLIILVFLNVLSNVDLWNYVGVCSCFIPSDYFYYSPLFYWNILIIC